MRDTLVKERYKSLKPDWFEDKYKTIKPIISQVQKKIFLEWIDQETSDIVKNDIIQQHMEKLTDDLKKQAIETKIHDFIYKQLPKKNQKETVGEIQGMSEAKKNLLVKGQLEQKNISNQEFQELAKLCNIDYKKIFNDTETEIIDNHKNKLTQKDLDKQVRHRLKKMSQKKKMSLIASERKLEQKTKKIIREAINLDVKSFIKDYLNVIQLKDRNSISWNDVTQFSKHMISISDSEVEMHRLAKEKINDPEITDQELAEKVKNIIIKEYSVNLKSANDPAKLKELAENRLIEIRQKIILKLNQNLANSFVNLCNEKKSKEHSLSTKIINIVSRKVINKNTIMFKNVGTDGDKYFDISNHFSGYNTNQLATIFSGADAYLKGIVHGEFDVYRFTGNLYAVTNLEKSEVLISCINEYDPIAFNRQRFSGQQDAVIPHLVSMINALNRQIDTSNKENRRLMSVLQRTVNTLNHNQKTLIQKAGGKTYNTFIASKGTAGIMDSIPFLTFGFNEYKLTENHKKILQQFFKVMIAQPSIRIKIIGRTDPVGRISNNEIVSKRRAITVRDYLIKLGVNPESIIETTWLRYDAPIGSPTLKDHNNYNRSVQIKIASDI